MMANMGGGGSTLDKLLKAWGFSSKPQGGRRPELQDAVARPRNGTPQEAPAWLGVTRRWHQPG